MLHPQGLCLRRHLNFCRHCQKLVLQFPERKTDENFLCLLSYISSLVRIYVIIILFVIVSILLIYSLLLISVETKTHEIGIMRLVGLSKRNFTSMIFVQSFMFVLPSVICGFLFYIPVMMLIFSFLFTESLGFKPSYAPSTRAGV